MSNTKKDPNLCLGQAVNAMQAAQQAQASVNHQSLAARIQTVQGLAQCGAINAAQGATLLNSTQQWWNSPETVAVAHASALEPRLPDLPEEQLIQLYGLVVAQLMMRGLA